MVRKVVSIGDKIELKKIRLSSKEVENEQIYKSRILDFTNEDGASILMPIEKGRVIPLTVGDKYTLRFYTIKGLYQCKAIITGRSRVNNVYFLNVEFISDLEKYQRRQFYRLECLLEIDYYIISDIEISILNKLKMNEFKDENEKQSYENVLEECKKEWLRGTILDISGGGARFVSDKLHEYGDLLQISIQLRNGDKNARLKAMIISSDKMINRQGFYEHRIQFRDIIKEDREAIIKFIFEEERRQRNKEKGK